MRDSSHTKISQRLFIWIATVDQRGAAIGCPDEYAVGLANINEMHFQQAIIGLNRGNGDRFTGIGGNSANCLVSGEETIALLSTVIGASCLISDGTGFPASE